MHGSENLLVTIKDSEIEKLFKEIMLHCRAERRAASGRSLRDLAKELGTTENYLSAVENGREMPSLPVLIRYLLINGFDLEPLRTLSIPKKARANDPEVKNKVALIDKIYSLDADQVQFLAEQAKVATNLRLKMKRPR